MAEGISIAFQDLLIGATALHIGFDIVTLNVRPPCWPTIVAVESAVLHPDGVMDNLPSGATHISMSTISVALSQQAGGRARQARTSYIAAPVFGRPDAAEAGKLFVRRPAIRDLVERCRPVLEASDRRYSSSATSRRWPMW